MNKISENEKPSLWNDSTVLSTRISVLNCGSIRPQLQHISSDRRLTISDAICLTETWLWSDEETAGIEIDGFQAHHNAVGRGKGVSVYYKDSKFTHTQDITDEKIQITKLSGKQLDIIVVYKAPTGNDGILQEHLQNMMNNNKSTIVCGDFNMCYVDNRQNKSISLLEQKGFKQLVKEATHIEGGHIDHVYIRSEGLSATVEMYSPYYTAKDHDALCISIPESKE